VRGLVELRRFVDVHPAEVLAEPPPPLAGRHRFVEAALDDAGGEVGVPGDPAHGEARQHAGHLPRGGDLGRGDEVGDEPRRAQERGAGRAHDSACRVIVAMTADLAAAYASIDGHASRSSRRLTSA